MLTQYRTDVFTAEPMAAYQARRAELLWPSAIASMIGQQKARRLNCCGLEILAHFLMLSALLLLEQLSNTL